MYERRNFTPSRDKASVSGGTLYSFFSSNGTCDMLHLHLYLIHSVLGDSVHLHLIYHFRT